MQQRYTPGGQSDWATASSPALTRATAEIGGWEVAMSTDLRAFKFRENSVEYAEGPHAELVGPLPDRGPPTGLVLHRGRIAGQWGAPARADIAFSVTKSFLSTLAGLALAEGLIPALDAVVSSSFNAPEFAGGANAAITWRHLLTLTSEWEGSLWTIPDSIDFNRAVPKRPDAPPKGMPRDRRRPGGYWEFNDVRVNLLALALTHAFGDSLETILRQRIMDPIGASPGWQWHGYKNSDLYIGGKTVKVVAGGAHWGGGMIIPSYDLARLALLYLNRGRWGDRQLLPNTWFDALRAPGWLNPSFGLMWWNNSAGTIAALSPQAIWGSGISNFLVVDPGQDLVVVMRWYDLARRDEILTRIVAALPA